MRIFLSHDSQDKALVRRLTDGLPKHVQRWLDADELRTGQKFADHIEAGIRLECDFFLVFIDEASLASDWVKREVALALGRQRDLQRPYVLPVLIGDVAHRMGELGLAPEERLYLDARDHSDAGVAASAAALHAELFKHASELVERLRSADRRALIDGFSAELAEFEQVAFRWVASMGNDIEYIAALPAAAAHVRECLAAYNAVADRFIPRLATHRDRLLAGWREHRSVCKHIAELIDQIEDGVYRGAMFKLNEVLNLVHAEMLAIEQGAPDAARVAAGNERRRELLAAATAAIDAMTRDASELVADLHAELED
jgi:TIR domain